MRQSKHPNEEVAPTIALKLHLTSIEASVPDFDRRHLAPSNPKKMGCTQPRIPRVRPIFLGQAARQVLRLRKSGQWLLSIPNLMASRALASAFDQRQPA